MKSKPMRKLFIVFLFISFYGKAQFGIPIPSGRIPTDWKSSAVTWSNYNTARQYVNGLYSQTNDFNSYPTPILAGGNECYNEGCMQHPNGYVYGGPTNGNMVRFDPSSNTATHIATGANGYLFAILAPNGKIYFMPYITGNIGVYDPSIDAFYTFGSFTGGAGANLYNGAALFPNGHIISLPGKAGNILDINPASVPGSSSGDSFTTWGTFTETATNFLYAGLTVGPDGYGYGSCFDARKIPKVDAVGQTVTFPFALQNAGTQKWASIVNGTNGKMYCGSYTRGFCLEIDPVAVTATEFGSGSLQKYGGMAMALDGMIYAFPQNSTTMLKIDPSGPTASEIGGPFDNTKSYIGTILLSDGRLFGMSFTTTDFQTYKSKLSVRLNDNIACSLFYNKY